MDKKDTIRRGNIVTSIPDDTAPGRYLGNGSFGTVIAPYGLNAQPERQTAYPMEGRSVFCHMAHWGRFRFLSDATQKETVADYLLPLFRVCWEEEPKRVREYFQQQCFWDGTVTTSFTLPSGQRICVAGWTDMHSKALAGFQISVSEGACSLLLAAVTKFIPYAFVYKTETIQTAEVHQTADGWCMTISCGDTVNQPHSKVYLKTNASVEPMEDGLRIIASGETELLLSFGSPTEITCAESRKASADAWHEIWNRSGMFSFPEQRMQQTFVRSFAYLLSSYSDDRYGIQPTSGLSGNMFPFHFVQDMGYIAPALQMLGHGQIVERWLEHFAACIPEMREYAKHLWPDADGIYPPWELPFGDMRDYHRPGVPVIYCYEPHNVGYLCRMAAEAAQFKQDAQWTSRIAEPLIQECAAFYRSFFRKGTDGQWHFYCFPCMGQDEAGGRNQSDYLCSLYSAKYCFTAMLTFGLDDTGQYEVFLNDGLCFDSLMSARGTFHTCCGADDFGKQKHPVQLDGITYMPTQSAPLPQERKAYELRLDITDGAKTPFFAGWTLGQFLLAGSNLGCAAGWLYDWERIRASDITDENWVQFYESSGQPEKSFYMATHGMVLQSLIRNYVNDYWGRIDIAACPVLPDGVEFEKIHTRLGITVSGKMEHGVCRVTQTEETR